MFSGNLLKSYKKFLYQHLIPMLKQKGLLISYSYNGEIRGFSKEEVKQVLNYHFDEKEVGEDKILIYEK